MIGHGWRAGFAGFEGADDTQRTVTDTSIAAVVRQAHPEWDNPDDEELITGPYTKNGATRALALMAKGGAPADVYTVLSRANMDTASFVASLNAGVPIPVIMAAISAGQFEGGSDPTQVTVPWFDAAGNFLAAQVPTVASSTSPGSSSSTLATDPMTADNIAYRSILDVANNPISPATAAAEAAAAANINIGGVSVSPWLLGAGALGLLLLARR